MTAENKTRKHAKGKWHGILTELGFTEKELSGEHGPCPICEGKDRFRFTDYKSNGDYFCSGCGPGSGFDLIMQKFDWEFGYTARRVDAILGAGVEEVFKPKVDVEKRRRDLNAIWRKAQSPTLLRSWLEGRGLKCDERWTDLRGIRDMFMSGSNQLHEGMLALVRNKSGIPISIHRTYFDAKQRKMMPPTEKVAGAAIRIGRPVGDTLVIGEGVETTIAGMMHNNVAAGYATISAHGMEVVELPATIETVIILGDNDHSFTGQRAAFTLARRMDNDKKSVIVQMPEERGDDFNDFVRQEEYGLMEWDE